MNSISDQIWGIADEVRAQLGHTNWPETLLGLLAAELRDDAGPPIALGAGTRPMDEPSSQLRAQVAGLASGLKELPQRERSLATDELFNGLLGRDYWSELHTPPDVNELLVRLAGGESAPQESDTWYDPACGTAGSATAVDLVYGPGSGRYLGQELSAEAVQLAQVRSLISGRPIELYEGDTLRVDGFEADSAAYAVCAPPFGLKLGHESASRFARVWPDAPAERDSSTLFVLAALAKLRAAKDGGGTAAVLSVQNVLTGSKAAAFRHWLLDQGLLVGIVQLPDQLLNNTGLATTVLVLSNRPGRSRDEIRVVDATGLFSDSRAPRAERRRSLGAEHSKRIASEFWSPENRKFARTIPTSRLRYRRLTVTRADPTDGDRPPGWFSMDVLDTPSALAEVQSDTCPQLVAKDEGAVVYQIQLDDLMGGRFEQFRGYVRKFGGELACLGQVVASFATLRGDERELDWPENSVLIAAAGRRVDTEPPADASRSRGVLVTLDSEICINDYVALVLGGPVGELVLPATTPGSIPRPVSRHDVLSARIPVPSLEAQAAMVAEWRRLEVLSAEVRRLQTILVADYRLTVQVGDEAERLTEASTLESWLKSVPYPVASAIWAYRSMTNASDQLDQLVKAFESTAEFTAMVLLSACSRDEDLAAQVFPDLIKTLAAGGMSLERATFGTWATTVTMIAKRFRTMLDLDPENRQRCLRAFRTTDVAFVRDLTSTELGSLFKEVNSLRNRWIGHSGIRSQKESISRVEELLSRLVELQQLMLSTWRRVILVAPGHSTYRGGKHHYSARRLSGLSVPFENIDLELGDPMEHDRLHLYFAGDDTALELVPLVQMGQAPSAASDSFYFFNRIDSTNRVRLVSYHHPDSPEILIESNGLLDFVRSITSRTFVDSPPDSASP